MAYGSTGYQPMSSPATPRQFLFGEGGLGGYYNAGAAKAGVWGPAAMSYYPGSSGGSGGLSGQGSTMLGGMDITSMLAQILQQGPGSDQELLDSSMADIDQQQASSLNQLKNRFSGAGRPLSSTEYGSQESEMTSAFSRARSAARANASQAGLQRYATTLNPLLTVLKMMAGEGPVFNQYQNPNVPGMIIPRY